MSTSISHKHMSKQKSASLKIDQLKFAQRSLGFLRFLSSRNPKSLRLPNDHPSVVFNTDPKSPSPSLPRVSPSPNLAAKMGVDYLKSNEAAGSFTDNGYTHGANFLRALVDVMWRNPVLVDPNIVPCESDAGGGDSVPQSQSPTPHPRSVSIRRSSSMPASMAMFMPPMLDDVRRDTWSLAMESMCIIVLTDPVLRKWPGTMVDDLQEREFRPAPVPVARNPPLQNGMRRQSSIALGRKGHKLGVMLTRKDGDGDPTGGKPLNRCDVTGIKTGKGSLLNKCSVGSLVKRSLDPSRRFSVTVDQVQARVKVNADGFHDASQSNHWLRYEELATGQLVPREADVKIQR